MQAASMSVKGVRLRPPDYVVLGMVRLGAQSGYDIKKSVRDLIRFFWTISEAQIYPSLDRLERAALVRGALRRKAGAGAGTSTSRRKVRLLSAGG